MSCSPTSPQPGRIRAVVESVLVLHLQDKLLQGLIEQKLEQQYLQVKYCDSCHANSVTRALLREAEGCRKGRFPGNIRVIGMS